MAVPGRARGCAALEAAEQQAAVDGLGGEVARVRLLVGELLLAPQRAERGEVDAGAGGAVQRCVIE